MRPVAFSRYIALSGRLQRAAYMPPLQMTRNFVITAKLRAGHTPPLPRNDLFVAIFRDDAVFSAGLYGTVLTVPCGFSDMS